MGAVDNSVSDPVEMKKRQLLLKIFPQVVQYESVGRLILDVPFTEIMVKKTSLCIKLP